MPENNYFQCFNKLQKALRCNIQALANINKQHVTNLAYLHTTSWPTGKLRGEKQEVCLIISNKTSAKRLAFLCLMADVPLL